MQGPAGADPLWHWPSRLQTTRMGNEGSAMRFNAAGTYRDRIQGALVTV